jgi:Cellulase (glycosyl hydrolase family 5)
MRLVRWRPRARTVALAAAGVSAALAGGYTLTSLGGSASTAEAATAPPPKVSGLHVRGNRLLDGHGRLVRLRGVNRSGAEYACVQGWGIFDGPAGVRSVRAMAAWHVNAVRLMLNEDCWLGINGIAPAYSGVRYRRAIVSYVRLLHRYHMYVELSLAWGAPGRNRATYQSGAPDADHAPAMWTSLARTFRADRNVILAPWGETIVNPTCFLRGGTCEATYGPSNTPYRTAGMQQAVTLMRRAGYRGVIAIPGVDYANDLSHWLSRRPRDPLNQLVAEAHVYGNNGCASNGCLNRTIAPVARRVPVIFGETGESYDDSDCGSTRMRRLLRWADAHRVGYMAWTWATWGTCSALISSYSGAPLHPYGAFVRLHLLGRA